MKEKFYLVTGNRGLWKRLKLLLEHAVVKYLLQKRSGKYHLLLFSVACTAVPSPGDASFISYKCSLHDFCQQCNILPPRFSTSKHDTGYTSSVSFLYISFFQFVDCIPTVFFYIFFCIFPWYNFFPICITYLLIIPPA